MPFYEVICTDCEAIEEVFHGVKEPDPTKCKLCGGKLRRYWENMRIALKTNTSWMSGRGDLLKQFGGDERLLASRVEAARQQGYDVQRNDVYIPQLAERVGDPAAFLPADDPLGAMKRVLAKKNMSCDGRVIAKRECKPVRPKKISEKIVLDRLRKAIRNNPELARDKRELTKLKHQLVQRHGKQDI